jgi:hypothetical protein
MARDTIAQLTAGYRARSGSVVGPALTNAKRCVLAQKVPNRQENGYVQIPPVGLRDCVGAKALPQNAHRLVIIAEKSAAEVQRLLFDSHHASHLCHNPLCILADHLVVESKTDNEERKACKHRVLVWFTLAGVRYELPPAPCPHEPKCLPDIEERVPLAVS